MVQFHYTVTEKFITSVHGVFIPSASGKLLRNDGLVNSIDVPIVWIDGRETMIWRIKPWA
jgi:hypothetical protein